MTTIQVQTQLPLKTLLHSLAHLNLKELHAVSKQTALLRARRIAPSLPEKEAQLLLKINQGVIPQNTRTQCAALTKKSRQGHITKQEQAELNDLVNEIELLNAKRIGYLAQLSQLRQISLPVLMDKLEIQPLSYA